MPKLYRFDGDKKEYWETWENENGSYTVHWGKLGTTGNTKTIKPSLLKRAKAKIQKEMDKTISNNFRQIDLEDHYILLIEFPVDSMGTKEDVEKRHRLQDRMDETLGWTGLGHCDGGSIGSGTMEVCNFVVDFELAKEVIENDLRNTEFGDYSRIYDENA